MLHNGPLRAADAAWTLQQTWTTSPHWKRSKERHGRLFSATILAQPTRSQTPECIAVCHSRAGTHVKCCLRVKPCYRLAPRVVRKRFFQSPFESFYLNTLTFAPLKWRFREPMILYTCVLMNACIIRATTKGKQQNQNVKFNIQVGIPTFQNASILVPVQHFNRNKGGLLLPKRNGRRPCSLWCDPRTAERERGERRAPAPPIKRTFAHFPAYSFPRAPDALNLFVTLKCSGVALNCETRNLKQVPRAGSTPRKKKKKMGPCAWRRGLSCGRRFTEEKQPLPSR